MSEHAQRLPAKSLRCTCLEVKASLPPTALPSVLAFPVWEAELRSQVCLSDHSKADDPTHPSTRGPPLEGAGIAPGRGPGTRRERKLDERETEGSRPRGAPLLMSRALLGASLSSQSD